MAKQTLTERVNRLEQRVLDQENLPRGATWADIEGLDHRLTGLENKMEELQKQAPVFKTLAEMHDQLTRLGTRYNRRFGHEGKKCRHCNAPAYSDNPSPYCTECDKVL